MKTNISFFLKSVLFGTLSASVFSALVLGINEAIRHNTAAHQLWPDWLSGAVFGAIGGVVIAILIAAIMLIAKKQNIHWLCIITALVVCSFLFYWTI